MTSSKTSPLQKIVFSIVLLLMSFLIVEVGFRGIMAFRVGPSVLLYGISASQQTVSDVMHHNNDVGAYSKYYPNQTRVDYDVDTGGRIDVRINQSGFRGEDFAVEKAPGVLRVVTLGASSTFGYHSADHQTYPFLLQENLNEACEDEITHEVINLGIPHLRSEQILSLLVNEGLSLDPDVVTFYEGINDTARTEESASKAASRNRVLNHLGFVRRAYRFLVDHVLIVDLVNSTVFHKTENVLPEDFDGYAKDKVDSFLGNLERMHQLCEERGVVFIVANQQTKSGIIPRDKIQGVSYAEEQGIVAKKLGQAGAISPNEMYFLTHGRLMAALKSWTEENRIPFVDVIGQLNPTRDVLVSWVHLNPAGNAMVAKALTKDILAVTCGD